MYYFAHGTWIEQSFLQQPWRYKKGWHWHFYIASSHLFICKASSMRKAKCFCPFSKEKTVRVTKSFRKQCFCILLSRLWMWDERPFQERNWHMQPIVHTVLVDRDRVSDVESKVSRKTRIFENHVAMRSIDDYPTRRLLRTRRIKPINKCKY